MNLISICGKFCYERYKQKICLNLMQSMSQMKSSSDLLNNCIAVYQWVAIETDYVKRVYDIITNLNKPLL